MIFEDKNLSFETWASSKDGKPGSGKSTLMKFLMRHPRTKELLRTWAGDEDLIIADHYFWDAGTSLQKSRLGLLRTILVHIIFQCPEVAIQALPERFRRNTLSHCGLRWTQAELFETIKAVSLQKQKGVRLCFFIDGLDENTEEHVDLVELLSILADSPSIKLCVSSRPWNVFTRAYHETTDGQIAVQDLTQHDIKAYIHDKMSNNAHAHPLFSRHPTQWQDLIDNISHRAEGVFLWVRLVVRSLLRGLGNDDDLETLERRLVTYPNDLDGYFQRVFDRIEGVYLLTSARIMLAAIFAEAGLPIWAPRCIEREVTVPEYALTVEPRDRDLKNDADLIGITGATCAGWLVFGTKCPHIDDTDDLHNRPNPWEEDSDYIDHAQRTMQMESLGRYVDARCADLLEVQSDKVAFIHRTARDFLRQRELPNILLKQADPDFDVGLSLARIYLTKAKRSMYSGVGPMRDVVELVKPSNMEAYAALFDNYVKDVQSVHVLILPPQIQHLRMLAEVKEVGYKPFVADESEDFETLFGCHA
ncbi:hypothetical protein PRZ48_013130 [Zasmidium cellare]|uniref:NACHT domain-containing protein n=1 Tax=Zasmidium cellare TaxID=395010 RepID=A0ABR0E362_ZASCE|nr:hypothetical protein PRZ48_013130 [Zasmidium cellare]